MPAFRNPATDASDAFVSREHREAEIDWMRSLERPRHLDSLHALDSGPQLVGVRALHLVGRVEKRKEPLGEALLVRRESCDREARLESREAEPEKWEAIRKPVSGRRKHAGIDQRTAHGGRNRPGRGTGQRAHCPPDPTGEVLWFVARIPPPIVVIPLPRPRL